MRILALLAFMLLALADAATAQPAAAPVQGSEPLKARTAQLLTILKGSGDYDGFFTRGFIAQVPKSKFDVVNSQLTATLGAPTGIEQLKPLSTYAAELKVGYERGVADMRIVVSETPPHQVSGLLVTGTSGREATLGAVVETLNGLPGSTGFAFAKLAAGAPQLIASHNPDRPLAIGSTFKLVILAELVRATNAGERKGSDTVTLDGSPLPGGSYTQVPKGTAVTLEELASKMISVSDNSATDILLAHLGRKKVEAMIAPIGIRQAKGMLPFLSTLELFKLKGIDGGAIGRRYAALDENGRRALLDQELAGKPIEAISPTLFQGGKPIMIDTLEWFASPMDLVRVMDWLRRNTEKDSTARKILSINSGIGAPAAAKWRFVGYKGGSEPGVMNMTLLLQATDGAWYALSGGWNNPSAEVDEGRFAGLIGRAAELAAER